MCYSFDLKSATDRWPLLLLFEIMQYCFDRSFASSVVNSALASNVFEVPFVKRKASRRFIRSRATARVSCLFSLSSHSPTIYWCGGVRNRFTLDFSLSHMRYSAMMLSSLIKKWLRSMSLLLGSLGYKYYIIYIYYIYIYNPLSLTQAQQSLLSVFE